MYFKVSFLKAINEGLNFFVEFRFTKTAINFLYPKNINKESKNSLFLTDISNKRSKEYVFVELYFLEVKVLRFINVV